MGVCVLGSRGNGEGGGRGVSVGVLGSHGDGVMFVCVCV